MKAKQEVYVRNRIAKSTLSVKETVSGGSDILHIGSGLKPMKEDDNKETREPSPETSGAEKSAEVAHSTRTIGLNEYTCI